MSYRSEPAATTISKLNSQYFLPAIQREYVWKSEQIVQLFDSIMRRYPIGSFLFWELDSENRDKWEAYKFLEHGKQGGSHNEAATTDGVRNLTLILDGQQRLTSLLIGLRGFYTIKKKYKRWDDPSAWVKQRLHIDLLKDPVDPDEDGMDVEAGLYYHFAFLSDPKQADDNRYWFRVGQILDVEGEDKLEDFIDEEEERLPETVTKANIKTFRRNLRRLYEAIFKDEVIAFYTERDQNYDRVLDIFVRANEGGTKLSKSDLLLSMVTSKWGEMNAREEIYGFVDRLNEELTRRNSFDKDFIMKSCLVLSDLPIAYRVQNFNNRNLGKIQQSWPNIKSAIERGVDLANSFGIDRDNLTSANALIPMIYYLHQRPGLTLRGTTGFEVRNAGNCRRWLIASLLNQVFGGASDNILRDMRTELQSHAERDSDFPGPELNRVIAKAGRTASFDDYAIENVLDLTYGRQLTFLALTLLYDENGWGTIPHQMDHLFPRAMFRDKALEGIGIDTATRWKWQRLSNRLANLALLMSSENQGKSDQPFHEWLATRDTSFLQRHLIPQEPRLWRIENFPEFIEAREELIKVRLRTIAGTPAIEPEPEPELAD
ncbi:DUF262 domain-containing protein [Planctomycetales bacterium ZRK34]|nr:DUF262 domain-containing protein [Planctomycetales bacterium ZRK34]